MTDVLVLKQNGLGTSCINLGCGYYNAHSDEEITVKKDLLKCLRFVEHIIEDCTEIYPYTDMFDDHYECEEDIYDMLRMDPTLTPDDLYSMYSITFPYLKLEDYERFYETYQTLWAEDEREDPEDEIDGYISTD